VSPTVLVAVISIGYSGLWARRDDFRYTFPVGGYLTLGRTFGASAAGWEAMCAVHHHFETDETYSWRTVTLLGGPRFDLRRSGRHTLYAHGLIGLAHISTTYGDPYYPVPTFALGTGVDLTRAPGRVVRLGIDYRRVLLGEVPNEGLSLSLGLASGGR